MISSLLRTRAKDEKTWGEHNKYLSSTSKTVTWKDLYVALEAEQRLVGGITSRQIFNSPERTRAVPQSYELLEVHKLGIYHTLSQTGDV